MTHRVLLVVHGGRDQAVAIGQTAARALLAAGIQVCVTPDDVDAVTLPGVSVAADGADCDLVMVLGGDGTMLRAVELARPGDTPVLGVNLGHVGFLAEAEPDNIEAVVAAIVADRLAIERRVALAVRVTTPHGQTWESWALNEVAIEKSQPARMTNLVLSIDGKPLSQWACDGVLCSTPTGSTAYAFSAGGPVVWPEVDALLVVPISAHALFARPLVVAPGSTIDVDVATGPVVVACDGRRSFELSAGGRVRVTRASQSVRFARVHETTFTERLVAKFQLPVTGWRRG